ncbi:MAG: integrase, partial [Myxococcota bacterium]
MAVKGVVKVTGVYVDERPAGYRVRWRPIGEDGKRGSMVTGPTLPYTTTDLLGVNEYVLRVARSIDECGTFDPSVDNVRNAEPADLGFMVMAWVDARAASGKFKAKTAKTYRSYLIRCLDHIYALTGTETDQSVPVTVLNLSLFEGIHKRDRLSKSSAIISYAAPLALVNAWEWGYSRPEQFPKVPEPPRDRSDLLTKTPNYRPTVAPTMAHVDAMLRHLPKKTTELSRISILIERFTGLRGGTVIALTGADFDRDAATLHIRGEIDKNEYDRVVPVSHHLLAEIGDWLDLCGSGYLFPLRRHTKASKTGHRQKTPTVTIRKAWEAATEAGEAPVGVWNPATRKNARPLHAVRAAFDAFLIGQGAKPDVVDCLVGRSPSDVRGVHYGRDLEADLRAA